MAELFGHCAESNKIMLTVDGKIRVQCINHVAIGFYTIVMVCFK